MPGTAARRTSVNIPAWWRPDCDDPEREARVLVSGRGQMGPTNASGSAISAAIGLEARRERAEARSTRRRVQGREQRPKISTSGPEGEGACWERVGWWARERRQEQPAAPALPVCCLPACPPSGAPLALDPSGPPDPRPRWPCPANSLATRACSCIHAGTGSRSVLGRSEPGIGILRCIATAYRLPAPPQR